MHLPNLSATELFKHRWQYITQKVQHPPGSFKGRLGRESFAPFPEILPSKAPDPSYLGLPTPAHAGALQTVKMMLLPGGCIV
jgi:hypothetical protein